MVKVVVWINNCWLRFWVKIFLLLDIGGCCIVWGLFGFWLIKNFGILLVSMLIISNCFVNSGVF